MSEVTRTSDQPLLVAEALSKSYGRLAACRDVSFALYPGEVLAIVGESGSGKSTLARCIIRLIDPDAGSILLDGHDWALMSRREIRQRTQQMQMVFQDPFASLNPRRKAIDLVAQGPIVHGTPRDKALSEARELFQLPTPKSTRSSRTSAASWKACS